MPLRPRIMNSGGNPMVDDVVPSLRGSPHHVRPPLPLLLLLTRLLAAAHVPPIPHWLPPLTRPTERLGHLLIWLFLLAPPSLPAQPP
eukprot:5118642-Pyramimonas_sp.AAC.1